MENLYLIPEEDNLYRQKIEYIPQFTSDGEVDLCHLLKTFQEAAGIQIERLGLGDAFREKFNFYYVLCRLKGTFLSKPEKGKKYTLVTFPTKASILQMYRYAFIVDENDQLIFTLTSLWVIIDKDTRRLKTCRDFQKGMLEVLPHIDDVKPLNDEKLSAIEYNKEDYESVGDYVVEEKDIDTNSHMNNTIYMKVAQSFIHSSGIKEFEINFEKECFLNEKIHLEKAKCENESIDSVIGYKEDGNVSFVSEFIY